MKHTTRIVIANRRDQVLAEEGVIDPEAVQRLIVKDALVDTGATRLSLPKSLIAQLGLTPVGTARAMIANGMVTVPSIRRLNSHSWSGKRPSG